MGQNIQGDGQRILRLTSSIQNQIAFLKKSQAWSDILMRSQISIYSFVKCMSTLAVTLRFSFRTALDNDHKICVKWGSCNLSVESGDLPETVELLPSSGNTFSNDVRIEVDVPQRVLFRFEYDGCDPNRIGSYRVERSVQEPVLISEVDRRVDSGVTFRFKINYHTYFGQILAIVGSLPELGCWDVRKALELDHSGSVRRSPNGDGLFTDNKYNWQRDVKLPYLPEAISYRYFVRNECADPLMEPGNVRMLSFADGSLSPTLFEFNDLWRWNEITQTVFAKQLFGQTLFGRGNVGLPTIEYKRPSEAGEDMVRCVFCAHSGMVGKARSLAVVGSITELGQWNPSKGVKLEPVADLQWSTNVMIPKSRFPFEFKVVAIGGADSIVWETHENRWATLSDCSANDVVTMDCWHLSFPNLSFHGAGIVVDLNAVDDCDFGKLRQIVSWCKNVGFAAVHLVGLFDTTAMCEETDGLPVSGYALNPIFCDLAEYGYKPEPGSRSEILARKLAILKEVWDKHKTTLGAAVGDFKNKYSSWLSGYERICYGRKIGQDFPEEVDKDFADFVAFVQRKCSVDLAFLIQTALDSNVAIGVDLPFALSEKSAEAFGKPEIFMRDYSLGIQPSEDNPTGTLLKAYPYAFPEAEDFFKQRISFFSQLFSIIRLESTTCYFRQWIVPRETCVRAVFGHYQPSVNVSYAELETWGLWDVERYVQPYITHAILRELFHEDARAVELAFMELRESERSIAFKPEFSTERKLVDAVLPPREAELRDKYKEELLRLLGEVILIKAGPNEYRPRPVFTQAPSSKPGEKSFSFSELPSYNQSPFIRLEEEFMNNKQRTVWSFNGHKILQAITATSGATFFSDAAGINGEMCDEALQSVGIMPLRVQLEGRTRNAKFDDIRGYPYLSVACPQRVHSAQVPMRILWQSGDAQNLWEEEFWETGKAPAEYTDEVAANVMKQHCWSGSMWVMFPIDCLVGACQYIKKSPHAKYGVLDLQGFFSNETVADDIRKVLEQTKRT